MAQAPVGPVVGLSYGHLSRVLCVSTRALSSAHPVSAQISRLRIERTCDLGSCAQWPAGTSMGATATSSLVLRLSEVDAGLGWATQ